MKPGVRVAPAQLTTTSTLRSLVLLVPRQLDDDRRCAAKYGAVWDDYRRAVRWRIVPFIY